MDLRYKMIIIDDDENLYEEYKDSLEEFFKEKGFVLEVDGIHTYEDFLSKEKSLFKYSLFLVDLKFGFENTGDKIVSAIKEKMRVADVLFYSSSIQEIDEAKTKGIYEGVYFAKRRETHPREILDYAENLLTKQIINSNSAVNFIGLILQNFSIFDNTIKKLLLKYFNRIEAIDEKIKINNYHFLKINEKIEKNYSKFVSYIDDTYTSEHLPAYDTIQRSNKYILDLFISDYTLNDSYRLFMLLNHILKEKKYNGRGLLEDSYIKLNKLRNICAHGNTIHSNSVDIIQSNDGKIELTEDVCNEYRRLLVNFYEQLDSIESCI